MNIALWIVAGIAAAAFLAAGLMKITGKREQLLERMAWVADYSQTQVKVIGVVEVLGALGLILPAVTGIAPILVPVAATGLVIVMVLAAAMHLRRGDGFAAVVPNIVLGLMAAFVAWGRFGAYAF
ncbi:DoxX family protein [Longivirga aurantiaca]|uniref:DoxX family protein n=1 Tax=Longivirga aurantiaca TaxID=1837743 RepID=A0ABW1T4G7_9ACTN